MDLDALAAAPQIFADALDRLGPERFAEQPSPGEWSPAEILTHVRAADAVIAPRVLQVLARPGVALADFDERAVGAYLARVSLTAEDAAGAFRRGRSDLLALLAALTPEERARTGEHETRGAVSVDDICDALVDHEREHLAQLERAVQVLSTG